MVLSDKDQIEFVTLVGNRLEQVKDSIPYIETTHEASTFVTGSVGTLDYLAKELLSPDTYNIVDRHIKSEVKVINVMIERIRHT